MAKRTASMKAAQQKSVADERTPEEYFDEAKSGLLAIVDSYDRNAARPDNVVSDLVSIKEILVTEKPDINLALKMVSMRKEIYKEVALRLEAMTFEKITAEEWDDPFSDLLEYVDLDPGAPELVVFDDLMCKLARFDAVRPFGEKVEQLRMTLLEKIG